MIQASVLIAYSSRLLDRAASVIYLLIDPSPSLKFCSELLEFAIGDKAEAIKNKKDIS
ncbi:hypothetical protein AGMMS49949_04340 [Alphaproteobacteria bacterium]|nr:hypothetical protein AGMMS49949_04340 [Alphaproteobacteria bacterium]GHS97014.1 hypothetical protein AGMMS50296_3620 [Alphaproteobacteria bacterium]